MTVTDAAVVLLAAVVFALSCLLVSLRRRVSRTEVHCAILRDHLKHAEVMWASANHRLPKSLDFLR